MERFDHTHRRPGQSTAAALVGSQTPGGRPLEHRASRARRLSANELRPRSSNSWEHQKRGRKEARSGRSRHPLGLAMDPTAHITAMPPPIIVHDMIIDHPSCSSPLDADLQKRKVERQSVHSTPREAGSPALQERINCLNAGADPSASTSPVGTALLERRAARQMRQTTLQNEQTMPTQPLQR